MVNGKVKGDYMHDYISGLVIGEFLFFFMFGISGTNLLVVCIVIMLLRIEI